MKIIPAINSKLSFFSPPLKKYSTSFSSISKAFFMLEFPSWVWKCKNEFITRHKSCYLITLTRERPYNVGMARHMLALKCENDYFCSPQHFFAHMLVDFLKRIFPPWKIISHTCSFDIIIKWNNFHINYRVHFHLYCCQNT